MESRRHRLGDVVDDYCPRERRLSNHVIVAIVDDVVKQTRCTTCEFEHPYKEARVPARRAKKDATGALYKQVLDNVSEGGELGASRAVLKNNGQPASAEPEPDEAPKPALVAPRPVRTRPAAEPPAAPQPGATAPLAAAASNPAAPSPAPSNPEAPDTPRADDSPADEGPVHRTLIRATLPRPEGEAREPRPIPTFTVREAATRPKFRRFRPQGGARNGSGPQFGSGPTSPFTAQPRHPGNFKAGGNTHGNRAGGGQFHGNRPNRRGNKGR